MGRISNLQTEMKTREKIRDKFKNHRCGEIKRPPRPPAGVQNGSTGLNSRERGHVHRARSLVEGLSSAWVGTHWREKVSEQGRDFATSRAKSNSREREV